MQKGKEREAKGREGKERKGKEDKEKQRKGKTRQMLTTFGHQQRELPCREKKNSLKINVC